MEAPVHRLKTIHERFISSGESLCVAESCTGGLLSFWLTHLPDSSKYFKGGLVAYQTEVKIERLGLDAEKIKKEGLAAEYCALSMAQGVKNIFKADWAVSITGIAGPSQGDSGESVGTVAFSLCSQAGHKSSIKRMEGPKRKDIRHQAAFFALDFLISEFK